MTSRDSGIIDLFAIHEQSIAPPPPSAAPPAVSYDTGACDEELDGELDVFAADQRRSRTRARIIGGVVGAAAVLGVLALAIGASSHSRDGEKTSATVAAVAESTAFAADDATWVDELRALSAHVEGDTIRARLGDRTVEGRFAGFDAHGFLVLEHAGGREVVRSGEVFAW